MRTTLRKLPQGGYLWGYGPVNSTLTLCTKKFKDKKEAPSKKDSAPLPIILANSRTQRLFHLAFVTEFSLYRLGFWNSVPTPFNPEIFPTRFAYLIHELNGLHGFQSAYSIFAISTNAFGPKTTATPNHVSSFQVSRNDLNCFPSACAVTNRNRLSVSPDLHISDS